MRSATLLSVIVIASLAFAFNAGPNAASAEYQEGDAAGTVLEIRGEAYLLRGEDSKPIRLHKKRDLKRALYVGEKVRCGKGGFLRLQLHGKLIEIKSRDWYPIPHAAEKPAAAKRKAENVNRGGREARGNANEGFLERHRYYGRKRADVDNSDRLKKSKEVWGDKSKKDPPGPPSTRAKKPL